MTTKSEQLPAAVTHTVPHAAALLGISSAQYYVLFKRGEVPGRRLGHRIVVPALQLQRYIDGESWT